MKRGILLLVLFCLVPSVVGQTLKLDVPAKWRTESVALPPPFAPSVALKGQAQVYFSPGWGNKDSDQFFTYAFVFQTEAEPKFEKTVVKRELLAYFGGLAFAVSGGKVDPATFEMKVEQVKVDSEGELANSQRFNAELNWTEPFFTKSEQTLNMEMVTHFNAAEKRNYLMVCVSPQAPKGTTEASSKIWQEMRGIQAEFSGHSQGEEQTPEK